MVRKSLLVGNGINRLSGNDSWLNVLKYLAGPSKEEAIVRYSDHKPFTLIFEELVLDSGRFPSENEFELKQRVSDRLEEIKPNEYHYKIAKETPGHILTTNYDYTIERAAGGYERSPVLPESKYSIFRRVEANSENIWHIHGDLEAPNTIMLGHEHYLGCVKKMRNYLSSGVQSELVAGAIKSPLKEERPDFDFDKKRGNRENVFSWVDVFLRDELHILGFKLDYTEQHLWSLLTQKAHLSREYPSQVGKAYYHFFKDQGLTEEEKAKASILESLDVEVEVTEWEDSHHEAYEHFCSQHLS